MTVKSPSLLFELSIILNGLPITNPWAELQVNVDIPLTDSKSSDAMATAGPKLSAYCPDKNDVSTVVFAIATVLVLGTADIQKYPSVSVPIPVIWRTSPIFVDIPAVVKVAAAPIVGEPINVGSNSNFSAP